jgi:protein-tyrosine-phosphatase
MNNQLVTYIGRLKRNTSGISKHRRKNLLQISDFVGTKLRSEDQARLTFICTHNSRRSHFCQIWTATLAAYLGLEGVQAFSGGTEATAFHSNAIQALRRAGFKVENPGGDNPFYQVYYADDAEPLLCFSKTFDDQYNPQKDFIAVMTCSDADQNCPFVPGASFRITIPYIDPKKADDTPKETQIYDERCRQIAIEMFYLMSQV